MKLYNPFNRTVIGSAVFKALRAGLVPRLYAPWVQTSALEKGTGPVTFSTEATNGEFYHEQPDGTLVGCHADEPRITGARRSMNYFRDITYTSDAVPDLALGANTPALEWATGGNTYTSGGIAYFGGGTHGDNSISAQNVTGFNGYHSYRVRVTRLSGTESAVLGAVRIRELRGGVYTNNDYVTADFPIGVTKEIAFASTSYQPNGAFYLRVSSSLADPSTWRIENVMFGIETAATAPSEYISAGPGKVPAKYFQYANGNTIDASDVIHEAPGAVLTGLKGIRLEPPETNECNYSDDMNSWTKAAGVTVSSNFASAPIAVMEHGRMDRVECAAGGTGEDLSLTSSVAVANNAVRRYTFRFAKAAAPGTTLRVVTVLGGGTPITGGVDIDQSADPPTVSVVGTATNVKIKTIVSSLLWEVSYTLANDASGNTTQTYRIIPDAVASGARNVYVGAFKGSTVRYATSHIRTTGTPVTRDTTTLGVPYDDLSTCRDEGALSFDWTPQHTTSEMSIAASLMSIYASTGLLEPVHIKTSDSKMYLYNLVDGSNAGVSVAGIVAGTTYHVKARWSAKAGTMTLNVDGVETVGSAPAFTGWPIVSTNIRWNLGNTSLAVKNWKLFSKYPSDNEWSKM